MLRDRALRRDVRKARQLVQTGRYSEALRLIAQSVAQWSPPPTSVSGPLVAEALELEARIHLQLGDEESALRAYLKAIEIIRPFPRHAVALGQYLYEVATLGIDIFPEETLAAYLNESRSLLRGSRAHRHYVITINELLDAESEDKEDRIQRLFELVEHARSPEEEFAYSARLSQALISQPDAADAQMGFDGLVYHCQLLAEMEEWNRFFDNYANLSHLFDRSDVAVSADALPLADLAVAAAERLRAPAIIAVAYAVRGVLHARLGESERALTDAIRAVAADELASSRTTATLLRTLAAHRDKQARDLALWLSIDLGDADLAAELIESSRLQVVPNFGFSTAPSLKAVDGDAVLGVGAASLGDVQQISVSGYSRIARTRSDEGALAVLPLEQAIESVAGSRAWWWGLWPGLNGRLYWATRSPDGDGSAGMISVEPNSPEQALLSRAESTLPWQANEILDVLRGPFCSSYDDERAVSSALGRLLIPPPLADALRATARPISVVLASNFLSLLPVPLFRIPGIVDDIALIERAVIRWQPPCAVLAAADVWPVVVACLDPDGTLSNARHMDLNAAFVLTGSKNPNQAPVGAVIATEANLRNALRSVGRSSPGLFFYSGHVHPGVSGNSLDTALVLEQQSLLAARAFLASDSESQGLPVPARVLLSACESSGAAGTGKGEWLGLTATMLLAGARQVIATSWPVWDTPFTAAVDRKLLDVMTTRRDVAAGLREVQVEALQAWRTWPYQYADLQEAVGPSLGDFPAPVTWASFQSLGLLV